MSIGAANVGCIFVYFKGANNLLVPDVMGDFGAGISNAQPIILIPNQWTPIPINDTLKESLNSGALADLSKRDLLIFANSESEASILDKQIKEQIAKDPNFLKKNEKVAPITVAESKDIFQKYGAPATAALVKQYRTEKGLDPMTGKPVVAKVAAQAVQAAQDVQESQTVPVQQAPVQEAPVNAGLVELNTKVDALIGAVTSLVNVMQTNQTSAKPKKKKKK